VSLRESGRSRAFECVAKPKQKRIGQTRQDFQDSQDEENVEMSVSIEQSSQS
jgi:hypothetical protein